MTNTDLQHRYSQTVEALLAEGLIEKGELPPLEQLVKTIRDWCDDESQQFTSFDEFFAWLETLTVYDAMDYGVSLEAHKPAMAIAYEAMVQEPSSETAPAE